MAFAEFACPEERPSAPATNAHSTQGELHPLPSAGMVQGKELQIVVFTDAFFETNGVGSYYKTLLGWCAERTGIRVTIICPERDDLVRGDIPKHVIPIRGLIQFRNPFYKDLVFGYYSQTKLRKIVESIERPKIIHIATTGLLGVGGARVARRLRLPCVGCYHVNTLEFTELYGSTSFGRVGGWVAAGGVLLGAGDLLPEALAICCELVGLFEKFGMPLNNADRRLEQVAVFLVVEVRSQVLHLAGEQDAFCKAQRVDGLR
ncbi:MAG: glycosyltransferase [Planctomycetes bacterium]|nr:glycosyltransferase [Planctomycetota bacterium]